MSFVKTQKQAAAVRLLGGDAKHIMLYGGSRSGKTFILIFAIVLRALKKKSRHVILRQAFNHVKASVWYDTLPKVMSLCFPGMTYEENKSDWFIELQNGSQIWFGGLDSKERTEKILGNEYSTIYFNECSQMSYESVLMAITRLAENSGLVNKIYYDCNPPRVGHWIYRLFVLGVDPVSGEKKKAEQYAYMQMNPDDNIENLTSDYIDLLDGLPKAQRERFRHGNFLDTVDGALWTQSMIDKWRATDYPELMTVVVAIDPAVSTNAESDETGMIVGGKCYDGNIYILEDLSGVMSPREWAERAIRSYKVNKADHITGEVNNGGDLVESNITVRDSTVPFKQVRATRGKTTRAEPVVNLYEQGKVRHVGIFNDLEEQMCTWDCKSGSKSPDRVDALVWLVTDLMDIDNTNIWV